MSTQDVTGADLFAPLRGSGNPEQEPRSCSTKDPVRSRSGGSESFLEIVLAQAAYEYETPCMKNELTTYKCTGKNTRSLTVAAGNEKDAKRIYRSFFPKNRIKDIDCFSLVEAELAEVRKATAALNAGCGV